MAASSSATAVRAVPRLIDVRPPAHRAGWSAQVRRLVAGPVERLLGLDHVNDIFTACSRCQHGGPPDGATFLRAVLDHLEVRFRLPAIDLARIPASGPVLVVANHPFGAIDGIALAVALLSVRPDVRVMGNHLLRCIPDLRDVFLFVDPFNPGAGRENMAGMRQAIRWLHEGGLLMTFPAGEVAHLSLRHRRVREPVWSPSIARLARRAGVPVLPVYVDGRNSAVFQSVGVIHPRLRTALLAREVWNKRGSRVDFRVGTPVPAPQMEGFTDDAALAAHLRQRTLLLQHRAVEPVPPRPVNTASWPDVTAPIDPALLALDIARLPVDARLADGDNLAVYCAPAEQIPHVLQEIGRLREVTFRAVGEGTGRPTDLDRFDNDYLHLFVWHAPRREVVGAYRLGPTDDLLARRGPAGLYTRTLFRYDDRLLRRMGTAIELGRSFVRGEYQRAYAPLLLLWRGVGTFCVRHPQYRTLFGPVSISNDYHSISKDLMVRFLQANHGPDPDTPAWDALVRPRHPYRPATRRLAAVDPLDAPPRDEGAVCRLVSEVERDGKGMPVLLRQYLRLGAKYLAFNVDPAFNDAVDGLIAIDLTRSDPRVLRRYMGREGHATFMTAHRAEAMPIG